jgi:hypothetical protein
MRRIDVSWGVVGMVLYSEEFKVDEVDASGTGGLMRALEKRRLGLTSSTCKRG